MMFVTARSKWIGALISAGPLGSEAIMKERKAALLHFHSFKAMREIAELLCTYGRTEETIIHGIPAHAAPNAEPAIRLEGHRMADGLRQSLIDYADWRAMGEIQADWSRLSSSAAAIRLGKILTRAKHSRSKIFQVLRRRPFRHGRCSNCARCPR
jgi:hypothetical protein